MDLPGVICLFVVYLLYGAPCGQAHWGYNNVLDEEPPTKWQLDYPACNGSRQSPIAIDQALVRQDDYLEPVNFTHFDQHPLNDMWTIVDNGHVVQFSGNFPDGAVPFIQGGSLLGAAYVFEQFHFHWGSTDSRGSEHTFDGRRYPLEMHIVLRKTTENDTIAYGDPTGMAVVSVMFDVVGPNETGNSQMAALTHALTMITDPDVLVDAKLPALSLSALLPASPDYYRYFGSLTTPPCVEAVIWSVMKQPQKITEDQLNVFRSLHEKPTDAVDLLEDNFRPVQQGNGRVIKVYTSGGITNHTAAPVVIAASPTNVDTTLSPSSLSQKSSGNSVTNLKTLYIYSIIVLQFCCLFG